MDFPSSFSGQESIAPQPDPTSAPPASVPQGSPPVGPAMPRPYGAPVPMPSYAQGSANMAAAALVTSFVGAALGASRYGAKGGAVGFLLTGSAWNLARVARLKSDPDPSRQEEALWSGIYAVLGLGAGGWLAYQLSQK